MIFRIGAFISKTQSNEKDFFIQSRLLASEDRAAAQAQGDSREQEPPDGGGEGVAEQTDGGEHGADRRHLARAEAVDELVGKEAGDDGKQAEIGGNQARCGDGEAELPRHDRPRGAEEGIGDSETDEADVDDNEEKGGHGDTSRLEWFHCTIFLGTVQEKGIVFPLFG